MSERKLTSRQIGNADRQVWNLPPPFRCEGGLAWVADLPQELWEQTDRNRTPHRSRLRLFEDGRELGPAHAGHAVIADRGRGGYSFWQKVVYFSTSDGSGPNTNGRSYTVARAERRSDVRDSLRAIMPAHASARWTVTDRPFRCAILGLGNRGRALARILMDLSGVEITWLVDRSEQRIAHFRSLVGDREIQGTTELAAAVADPLVDAVFIALPDHVHRQAAELAFGAGKNVYLEKPLATTADDAKALLRAWQKAGKALQIGYVLRTAPFYQAIRNVIRQGRLGQVRIISASEHLHVLHGASFMRRWHAASAQSGGLIVHKSCHDLDLICWLLDSRPRYVSSFGGVGTFQREPPAPFCSQCSVRADCVYADAGLHEYRTPAEQADPTAYGLDRCVFRVNQNIVDNQVISFELASGVRGTFSLAMQGPDRSERRIAIIGDAARLDGVFDDGTFTISYADAERDPLQWSVDAAIGSHGGGDALTVINFLDACLKRSPPPIKSIPGALAGLVFALAAEEARKTHSVVTLKNDDFELTPGG